MGLKRALGAPARLMDKYSDWDLRTERRVVEEGHEAMRGMALRLVVRLLVGLGAMVGVQLTPDNTVWHSLATVALGLIVGTWAGSSLRRAGAYRNGWIDGRVRMVNGMKQHDNPRDWLDAEGNHDIVHVMGYEPLPPPPGSNPGEGR